MKYFIGYFRKCDLVTMLGTTFGIIGIMLSLTSHYTLAVLCLIICGLCDAFDGTLARMKNYSNDEKEYGVQLDSLSDSICFGILPAILTYSLNPSSVTLIIGVFFALCGVIRLAYFNTLHIIGKAKKGIFIGVPITTIAIIYPIVFLIIRFINFSYLAKVMPIILLITGILFISRIEIKKINFPELLGKIFNKYVLLFVIFPLFIIFSADLFYRFLTFELVNVKNSIMTMINHPIPLIFTYVFVVLIVLIFLAISKTSKRTKLIMITISLILFMINDIKFAIMGNPIELSDVNFLKPSAMKMMGTATTTIGSWIWLTILKAVFYGLIGFVFIKLDKFSEIKIKKNKNRICILTGSLLLFVLLTIFTVNCNDFVIKKIYQTTKDEINQYLIVADYSNNYGLIQGMIISSINKIDSKPEGYESNIADELLSDSRDVSSEINWGKANVVFLLSESFSDLENIDEIEFDKPLMKEINEYEKDDDKMVFDLLVPTYGGSSVNSEYELLTGASLSFLPAGSIPYNTYYNTFTGNNAPNIIKEFKNNGYETIYLTPWASDSYNSKKNYTLIGIDKTVYGSDLNGEKKGQYYSDKSLMLDIYNELKTTSEGNYKFIMAATGQNHYPYNNKYEEHDIEITKSSLSSSSNDLLLNYAQGIYDASKELNNLYEMIKELDTPTIIVFFGDHLPDLIDNEGNDGYLQSSYLNNENWYLNYLRQYTTKAVILANYKIKTESINYLNINYLGAYVINNMDLEVSNYFKYIYNMSKIIPVFNRVGIYQNNSFIPLNNIDYKLTEELNNYKFIQYRSFYDIG